MAALGFFGGAGQHTQYEEMVDDRGRLNVFITPSPWMGEGRVRVSEGIRAISTYSSDRCGAVAMEAIAKPPV